MYSDGDRKSGKEETSGASGIATGTELFTAGASEWRWQTREMQV
jgi:hypothetical protein